MTENKCHNALQWCRCIAYLESNECQQQCAYAFAIIIQKTTSTLIKRTTNKLHQLSPVTYATLHRYSTGGRRVHPLALGLSASNSLPAYQWTKTIKTLTLEFLAFVVISCFLSTDSAPSALKITFRLVCYDNALYKCSINNNNNNNNIIATHYHTISTSVAHSTTNWHSSSSAARSATNSLSSYYPYHSFKHS